MLQPKMTELNSKNYYTNETDWEYQSPTWFKKFLSCEAEAVAELNGDYEPEWDNTALLVGNYLHSYFESDEAHKNFIEENKDEIMTKGTKTKPGKLKAPYEQAEKMIATLDNDPMFRGLYQGDKEVIVTGTIGGVKWKGKLDCLNLERGYFLDLKTSRDIHRRFWDNETRTWSSFVDAYNYQLQMWVYQELVRQTYGVIIPPYIIAVSKEKEPDKAVISIPNYRMEEAKSQIEDLQEHVEEVKQGIVKPRRCGVCDYCKKTAVLNNIISMDDLIE